MAKYDKMRSLLGMGSLNWVSNTLTIAIVSNYTFNATHATLADVQSSGGSVLASGRLSGKSVTSDGFAQSTSVTLRLVPPGGPYDVILFLDSTGQASGIYPLAHYLGAITSSTTGDILVRPEGALITGTGSWVRF